MPEPLVSICIPTFNRAEILRETLAALETEIDPSWEIVISNNYSDDHTNEVIEEFRGRWNSLRAITLKQHVKFTYNLDAAFRVARGKYIYSLMDDDRLVVDGILRAVDILEKNNQMVCVFGNYKEWYRETDTYESITLISEETVYPKGSQMEMFQKYHHIWFPVMRRDIFQRYCRYDNFSLGFMPLIGRMLTYGDIGLITDFLYLHANTMPRMEYHISEGWYHDMHRSQFETFIGEEIPGVEQNSLAISQVSIRPYKQGLQISLNKREYLKARSFIVRSRAYGLLSEDEIRDLEKRYIFHFMAEKVRDMASILPDIDEVVIEDHPVLRKLADILCDQAEDLKISFVGHAELNGISNLETKYILVKDYADLSSMRTQVGSPMFAGAALTDLFETYRITKCAFEDIVSIWGPN